MTAHKIGGDKLVNKMSGERDSGDCGDLSAVSQGKRKRKSYSYGLQCVSMYCSNKQYSWKDGIRTSTNISFFSFPKDEAGMKEWCRLIKRENNRDSFKVSGSTRLCEKHFETKFVYKPPGGTTKRLLSSAKPVLHPWNDWNTEASRKP